MKIAAVHALSALAREDVPDEVAVAYRGARPVYGPEYIIPVPFDPRLISRVSSAVAEAAIKSGVARREIKDMEAYRYALSARLDPAASLFQGITASVRANPKRVVFAEGEEEAVIRAAAAFQSSGLGKPLLSGREEIVRERIRRLGVEADPPLEVRTPRSAAEATAYIDALYRRLQRKGVLHRDCQRLVLNDRNIYAASMVAAGDADAHGHGRHAQLSGRAQRRAPGARSAARPAAHRRDADLFQGAASSSSPTPTCTKCRARPRWPTSRSRPRAWRGASATSRASRFFPIRPSASRTASAASA